jgi:hypothetical protein
MPTVNPFVGAGGADMYDYNDGPATSGIGSPANYTQGDPHGAGVHICVGAMLALAIGALILFNIGGFRAMVAVG